MTTAPVAAAAATRPAGSRRRTGAALAALLAILSGILVSTAVAAQQDTTSSDSTTVRIVAQKLESGRIEFGLQQRQTDTTWGDRQLPQVRFFPTTATVNRWLASSPLDVPAGEVRIVARKFESSRIEFGLQQRQTDTTWGDRQLPQVRFFPTTATVNRWLASSPLTLTAPQTAGQGAAITTGANSTCVLRTDNTVECWSNPSTDYSPNGLELIESQLIDAPAGRYTAITAGFAFSEAEYWSSWCLLRADGTLESSGGWSWSCGQDAPDGQHTAVSAGSLHWCALRTDSSIECWARTDYWQWQDRGQADAPDGQYTAVSAGWLHTCALRTDGTIECWGNNENGQAGAPDGQYTAVSTSWLHTCALRTDGTIECWGNNENGQADAPDAQYTAVSAGVAHTCALRTDGTIECWGNNENGQADAPDGQYTAVSAGGWHSSALRTDGTITIWGIKPQIFCCG